MRAVEFETTIHDGQIELPVDVVGEIPQGAQLRVVVMWEPSSAEAEWREAGRQGFAAAYCPEDSVYEQLINDSETR